MVYLCVAVNQDVSKCDDAGMLADQGSGLVIYLGELRQGLTDYLELAFNSRPQIGFCW